MAIQADQRGLQVGVAAHQHVDRNPRQGREPAGQHGPDAFGIVPLEQEERFRELALWMFVNDEAIHDIRPCVTAGTKDVYYTQSKDGRYVYALLTQFTSDNPERPLSGGDLSEKRCCSKN